MQSKATGVFRPDLDSRIGSAGYWLLAAIVAAAIVFVIHSVWADAMAVDRGRVALAPFVLLGVALLIALGFEFVNGFHDTANAVATVIYTQSLPPPAAVAWSGFFNFLGVLVSSGGVAFGIVSLLPVELILQVGSKAGFAMVFALLLAAILWNLGTWYFGLPSSSSHTLIGSIIGVGVANALMRGRDGTAGVDWSKAREIGEALLLSPLIGFGASLLLLLALKALVRNPALYREPEAGKAPPWWIRVILVLTCTGVSFAHGSNDGQKGMGLIMLILIGTMPTAYALNRAVPMHYEAHFHASGAAAAQVISAHAKGAAPADARAAVTRYIAERKFEPGTLPALSALISNIDRQVTLHGAVARVPAEASTNMRNDMYLAGSALKRLAKEPTQHFSEGEAAALSAYRADLDKATQFIPTWVKLAVAIALGLGTLVGWKRIVITLGERIGRTHLTYAQGAVAELVAMTTISLADMFGLPVSTTHVLSSGVAGTMVANRSGLQMTTLRNLLAAWTLTLPASILLSGLLYAGLSLVL